MVLPFIQQPPGPCRRALHWMQSSTWSGRFHPACQHLWCCLHTSTPSSGVVWTTFAHRLKQLEPQVCCSRAAQTFSGILIVVVYLTLSFAMCHIAECISRPCHLMHLVHSHRVKNVHTLVLEQWCMKLSLMCRVTCA